MLTPAVDLWILVLIYMCALNMSYCLYSELQCTVAELRSCCCWILLLALAADSYS